MKTLPLQAKIAAVVKEQEDLVAEYILEIDRLKKILDSPTSSPSIRQIAWSSLRLKFQIMKEAKIRAKFTIGKMIHPNVKGA